MKYHHRNKPQYEQTASPDKYPQGRFHDKACKKCGEMFSPKAPSHLYCSQDCADWALVTRYLKRTYNMNYDDYMGMHRQQDGKCAICSGEGFSMLPNGVKLVVDHCHDTGTVRGLLCHNCNRALGLLQDSLSSIQKAFDYIKKYKKE